MKAVSAILALLPVLGFSQPSLNWDNYPGGVSVAADAQNNVYSVNWDYNPAGDITLTKRDDAGNILWEVSYDNTNTSRHEVATWVETDSEDNIIVAGTIRSGYSNPVDANSLLMKFDPSGNLVWRVVYETDFDGSSTKKCLVDSQDNIYVLGFGFNGTGMSGQVKKFSPEGTVLWSYHDYAGIGKPINFKFTPDNAIIISARSIFGSVNGYSKIDLEGNTLWTLTGVYSLTVGDAAGDSNGNSYLINGEYVVQNAGSIVTKISPAGTAVWEQVNTMAGLRVEVGSDNFPVISGFPSSGSAGAAFMKYNESGDVMWQNLNADGPENNLLAHAQMKLDGSDAAYLAASIMTQMAFCKVNSNGITEWTVVVPGGYAASMDFGTDNSVFVTGGATARILQGSVVTSVNESRINVEKTNVFPNPFHSDVNITLNLSEPQLVSMWIVDACGQVVEELVNTRLTSGSYQYRWIPGGALNNEFSNGIYFLNIRKGGTLETKKIIYIN